MATNFTSFLLFYSQVIRLFVRHLQDTRDENEIMDL